MENKFQKQIENACNGDLLDDRARKEIKGFIMATNQVDVFGCYRNHIIDTTEYLRINRN